jgi:hypothetical protein
LISSTQAAWQVSSQVSRGTTFFTKLRTKFQALLSEERFLGANVLSILHVAHHIIATPAVTTWIVSRSEVLHHDDSWNDRTSGGTLDSAFQATEEAL